MVPSDFLYVFEPNGTLDMYMRMTICTYRPCKYIFISYKYEGNMVLKEVDNVFFPFTYWITHYQNNMHTRHNTASRPSMY
jgi:hypothetical protein